MTAITARLRREPILINGKPIPFEFAQSLGYGLLLALIIALVPAGVYFGTLEVHWYLPFGPEWMQHGFYLKHWWDNGMAKWVVPGFFAASTWPLYRHGWRDLMEPAVATFGVKTAMAKRWQKSDKRLGPVHLVLRVLAVFILATALVLCGVWAINFAVPARFGWEAVQLPFSIAQLALGIIVGLAVHTVWAPAGSTLQGTMVDRAVGSIRAARKRKGEPHWLPLYVRAELLAPPPVRKRIVHELATFDPTEKPPSKAQKRTAVAIIVLGVYLAALGFIGKYGVGVFGWHIPYLAP